MYTYTNLDASKEEIRLLVVEPGAGGAHLRASLKHVRLSDLTPWTFMYGEAVRACRAAEDVQCSVRPVQIGNAHYLY